MKTPKCRWFIVKNNGKRVVRSVFSFIRQEEESWLVESVDANDGLPDINPGSIRLEWTNGKFYENRKDAQIDILIQERFF